MNESATATKDPATGTDRAARTQPGARGGAAPPDAWAGTITLAPLVSLFVGWGGETRVHAHPAHKLVLGAEVVATRDACRRGERPVAIPASLPHRIRANARRVALVYLDARRFAWSDVERLAARLLPFDAARDDADALLGDLTAGPLRRALDARVERALEGLRSTEPIGAIAGRLRLSESRLSHLFNAELGAPPRSWRVWLRLRAALDEVAEGESVTRAAASAGFADAAHFARASRAALGIPPSLLQRSRLRLELGAHDCRAL